MKSPEPSKKVAKKQTPKAESPKKVVTKKRLDEEAPMQHMMESMFPETNTSGNLYSLVEHRLNNRLSIFVCYSLTCTPGNSWHLGCRDILMMEGNYWSSSLVHLAL